MTQVPTLIAGHSHVEALGVPLNSAGVAAVMPNTIAGSSFVGLSGTWPRASEYWTELVALAANHNIVISWEGNQYLNRYLFAMEPMIDFVCSSRPELPVNSSHVIVPELAMRETLSGSLKELEGLLGRLVKVKRNKLIVAGSPPPNDDDDFCRRCLGNERGFQIIAAKMGFDISTIEFAPPLFRLKCWILLQDMMAGLCKRFDVEFLLAPAEGRSSQGFLAPEYRAEKNATHANHKYGQLVISQIEKLIAFPTSTMQGQ